MTGLRIAFAGTPEFALPALRALMASRHGVVGVLTQPDRPSGRGRKLTASAVKEAALQHRLAVAQPSSLKTEAGRAELLHWNPDLLVVVAYGLILPPEVLSLPRLGCVNIHASLLPRWRGAAPIQRAILAGDAETGISIMQMDTGLDTGLILLQKRAAIHASDTSGALHDRLADLGAKALLQALDDIENGTIRSRAQPPEGATYAAKIEKSEALIDWRQSAPEIERKVRAFHPWPSAETRLGSEPLKIHTSHLARDTVAGITSKSVPKKHSFGRIDSDTDQYGSLIGLCDEALLVRCGQGTLAVTSLQRPGRRPVSALDFAHSVALDGRRFG